MHIKDDDDDYLEHKLIESFRKLKIVDLPKFTPRKPKKPIPAQLTHPKTEEESNIFDKNGNIESNFFTQDFNLNTAPKGIYTRVCQVMNYEKNEFVDDRINNDEEEDKEYGELNEKNEYPEDNDDESIYYGNKEEDPSMNVMVDEIFSDNNDGDDLETNYANNNNYNIDEGNETNEAIDEGNIYYTYPTKIQTIFDVEDDYED